MTEPKLGKCPRQLLYQEKLFGHQRKGGEDWAAVAENIKELAARAHPRSEDLAEGFALSRLLTLLQEDADLAVGVRRSAPKTLDDAVREATRLDSINQAVRKPKSVNPLEAAGTMAKGTWILEAASSHVKKQIHVANSVVKPEKGVVPVQVLNPGTESITIYAGDIVAKMEYMDTSKALLKKQALWELIETLSTELTLEQKRLIYALFIKYADVFPETKGDIGKTTLLQHKINTGDATPVHQRARRIPVFQRGEWQKLVKEMLDRGVIQPSSSPWASPVVLAKKKDGSLRFCVDYRKLNAVTRKDAYALPRIDDTLDALAGSKWFSTLDLASGYWQVGMHPDDREKTAFCTADGLFEFNVMPFGLCNAPATFQCLIDLILAGLQWSACLVYLADIIIMGKSFEEHLGNLGAVLERLQKAGLKLKPDKCAFLQKRVLYLGHIVSDQGITPDPGKTAKVTSWPIPNCVIELQAFLGLANYYRHFVKGFAEIAKTLHELTKKDSGFQWSPHCDAAFKILQGKLTSAPILGYPDLTKQFILDTDASDLSLGAVLSQVEDGKEKVLCYDSRLLTKEERHYCVTRKELLAVVTFVCKFRPYLVGRQFTLRTDHGALLWLHNFKEPEGQLARWLGKLQEFNYTIVHRPGQRHSNADAMSRMCCSQRKCPVHSSHPEKLTSVTTTDVAKQMTRNNSFKTQTLGQS
ncbi:hypothetical protein EMCRGX_G017449 [Ephydatia muelleri]